MKFIQNTTKGGFFRFPLFFRFAAANDHENSPLNCFAKEYIEVAVH